MSLRTSTTRCFSALAFASIAMLHAAGTTRAPVATRAQSPTPMFRAGVNLVEVDTVVTDQRGTFVKDLTRDDFDLFENGKKQTIASVTLVDLPRASSASVAAARGAPPADVQTNDTASLGRVYAIVLDTFHVAALHSAAARLRAKQFIDQYMMPGDLACVVTLGNSAASQEFTADKALLDAAVDRFIGEKAGSILVDQLLNEQHGGSGVDSEMPQRVSQTREAARGVIDVAHALAEFTGRRKALVFVSEGFDFDVAAASASRGAPAPPPAANTGSGPTGKRGGTASAGPAEPVAPMNDAQAFTPETLQLEASMVAEALRVNVQVYPVDPRGAAATEELLADLPPEAANHHNITSQLHQEIDRSQGTLRTLASETGGQSTVNTDGFDAGFSRLVEDNSEYYVIAYSPANTKEDGKFRDVSVKVKRPDLSVRARKGYYAPPAAAIAATPGANDVLTRLIRSPLPTSGLGLRVSAATLGPADAGRVRVSLVLEIDGSQLTFDAKDGAYLDALDVGYVVPDAEGKLVASNRETVDLHLEPDVKTAVARDGVRYLTEFSLPPGRYHLRVAAAEHDRALGGSVGDDLDVPKESAAPLAMGQLVITTGGARAMHTVGDWPSLKNLLPAPPAAIRRFTPSDLLAVLAHVHALPSTHATIADCSAVITSDAGRDAVTMHEEHAMSDLAGPEGWNYQLRLVLSDLAPGHYLLTMKVQAHGDDAEAARTIPIEITRPAGR